MQKYILVAFWRYEVLFEPSMVVKLLVGIENQTKTITLQVVLRP